MLARLSWVSPKAVSGYPSRGHRSSVPSGDADAQAFHVAKGPLQREALEERHLKGQTRSELGDFEVSWFEHLSQWLGTQWPGLSPWVSRAAQSRQARPEGVQEPSSGTAKGAL